MAHLLYHLAGPTAWAGPPASYSYSSLTAVDCCPRQWQLAHSTYGDLTRFPTRPHPSAVEGEIVHAVLDRLFKALAVRGMPSLGTPAFREGSAEADIQQSVRRFTAEHERLLTGQPRAGAFRLRTGPQQLASRVIRLFRGLYPQAVATHRAGGLPAAATRVSQQPPSGPALAALFRDRGALSELLLTHPALPFCCIIDLVWSGGAGAVVTDFKTGQARPEHKKQVAYCAVLWWRCSGAAPSQAEVRYPDHVESVHLNEGLLAGFEEELGRRIAAAGAALRVAPAQAVLGEHCKHCDVRQFCDAYWAGLPPPPLGPKAGDVPGRPRGRGDRRGR